MSDSENSSGSPWLLMGVIFVLPVVAVVSILVFLTDGDACVPATGATGTPADGAIPEDATVGPYDAEQLTNALTIANVAVGMGLGEQGAFLGILAAIGESTLVNVGYGDDIHGVTNPDGSATCSLGLFQQQWCLEGSPWGSTPDDVLDPVNAATMFLETLQAVPSWQTSEPSLVINQVQGNLDPWHYAPSEGDAQSILDYIKPYITGDLGAGGTGQCAAGAPTGNGELAFPLNPGFIMTDTYGPREAPTAGASSWHPAYDLINPGDACGAPIYSIAAGTVIAADNSWLQIQSDTGEAATYLHSPISTYTVTTGERVTAGQQIAAVGSEPPSTGCHLDIRIDKAGTTNANVAALESNDSLGGSWVNPNLYWRAVAGTDLCDAACLGSYSAGVGA